MSRKSHSLIACLSIITMFAFEAVRAEAAGLLVVAPHPDDDLLIASGVISAARGRGEPVVVVYITNGDASGVSAGGLRQGEAVAAQAQYLGATEDDLIFLGYPDGQLQTIFSNYSTVGSQFFTAFGQGTTYASRGLGRRDYHSFRFGSAAPYNWINIVTDLQAIITSYQPSHIVTVAEFDVHPDHSLTYTAVTQALDAKVAENPLYQPTIHKTIVWDDHFNNSVLWPELANPFAYHVIPPHLPAQLSWAERESLDVPLAMQTADTATNLKYLAIEAHTSQGGGAGFLGRFLHKDEFFWTETRSGIVPPLISAGASQVVAAGANVQLSGAGSRARAAGALTYRWRQVAGAPVSLSDASAVSPTFTAPAELASDMLLGFELVVTETGRASLPDLVRVMVQAESAPVHNIAPGATVTASSQNAGTGQLATKVIDGVADGYPGDYTREWAAQGERTGGWVRLQWPSPVTVGRVVLFDRPNASDYITSGVLTFSDGSSVVVGALHNDGSALEIPFNSRSVTSVTFTVTSASSSSQSVGLAEMQVYGSSGAGSPNLPPVANAGAGQTVSGGAAVTLNGGASSDPEGAALSYQWVQVSGNTVAVTGGNTAQLSFIAPTGLAQNATLGFRLIVSDGVQDSDPATVSVTVVAPNQISVNVAGAASVTASSQGVSTSQLAIRAVDDFIDGYPGDYTREWAAVGQGVGAWIQLDWGLPVTVNAISLYDRPNTNDHITGATLSFSDGSSVTVGALNNDGSATTVTFTARTVTSVRLTVTGVASSTQNVGLSELQIFSVGSQAVNQLPVANAGGAQTVAQNATVQLQGASSFDPEGAPLIYQWVQIGGPAVVLSSLSAASPMFIAPSGLSQDAVLSFQLVVNDGLAGSNPAVTTVTVTGSQTINLAPQATVFASSQNTSTDQLAGKAVDGVISGYPGDYTREWAALGERTGAWIELRWADPIVVSYVVIYDRPNASDQVSGATLTFSDGSTVSGPSLNNDGSATVVSFTPRTVTSLRFTVTATSGNTQNAGLSELQVFGAVAP